MNWPAVSYSGEIKSAISQKVPFGHNNTISTEKLHQLDTYAMVKIMDNVVEKEKRSEVLFSFQYI